MYGMVLSGCLKLVETWNGCSSGQARVETKQHYIIYNESDRLKRGYIPKCWYRLISQHFYTCAARHGNVYKATAAAHVQCSIG